MMLEHSQIAPYLLQHGFIEARDVVDGGLSVEDVSSRNRVFLTQTRDGPARVVKQAAPGGAAVLAHEADVLRALADVPALAAHVPRIAAFDASAAVLVLTTPSRGVTLSAAQGGGRIPRGLIGVLGRVLAELHSLPVDTVAPRDEDREPAWGRLLAALPYPMLLELSGAGREVLRRIQAAGELCDRLAALQPGTGVLVHGDLRWDNCIALPRGASGRRTGLMLVDWELAGAGSAALDVGAVLAELLRMWVLSIPIVAPGDPGRVPARIPLERLRPAAARFWEAYRAIRDIAPGHAAELAAVRLIQGAFELSDGFAEPPAGVMLLVQVAANILAGPERAAGELLGLRE
jgi:Ser/Thr protein kinase RdoA (MazF antagonist)